MQTRRRTVSLQLCPPQLLVNPPHPLHELVSAEATRRSAVTLVPVSIEKTHAGSLARCSFRSVTPYRDCQSPARQEMPTHQMSLSLARSSREACHISATTRPSSRSSIPISFSFSFSSSPDGGDDDPTPKLAPPFAPDDAGLSSGFVMRSTESPRHPAARRASRFGGGESNPFPLLLQLPFRACACTCVCGCTFGRRWARTLPTNTAS